MSSQAPVLISLLLMLILVGTSLFNRRLPAGTLIRLGAIWCAIFAGLFLIAKLAGWHI